VKSCPFCAEDIQDAAVVCKHCKRDLPMSTRSAQPASAAAQPAEKTFGFFAIVGFSALGFVALGLFIAIAQRIAPATPVNAECSLHARAAFVSRDTPLGRTLKWDTDVLAVRSDDSVAWKDIEATVFGFVTTGIDGKKPTGPYKYKNTRDSVEAGGLMAFSLNDFQKPSGEQWVSLTMTPSDVDIRANVGGAVCKAELSINTPVHDIISTNR